MWCVLASLCHSLWLYCVPDTIAGCSLPHSRRDGGGGGQSDVTERRPHRHQLSKCCLLLLGSKPAQWSNFSYMPKPFFILFFYLTLLSYFCPWIFAGAKSFLTRKFEGPRADSLSLAHRRVGTSVTSCEAWFLDTKAPADFPLVHLLSFSVTAELSFCGKRWNMTS